MAEIQFKVLCEKLNSLGFDTLNSAFGFAKMRGNPEVGLVHWLHQILQVQDSDIHQILNHFDVNRARLEKDFTNALDELKRGSGGRPSFSYQVHEATRSGWLYTTLLFGDTQMRLGYLLVGMLKEDTLRDALFDLSAEFERIKVESLTDQFSKIVNSSVEGSLQPPRLASSNLAAGNEAAQTSGAPALAKQEALGRFSVDLTEKARKGEIDPVLGRDDEIRQIVDILMRRRQNNPILTGEAGVGKTAVVEGFALRIAGRDVPPALQDVSLRTLDLGLLQAGASMKGEFENRLRQVIDEVQASPKPIILFIDEAHTLIGAGGQAGQGDAANLLKPALARGTLRTIAATTWAEYKKYFEKDPALTRRFQVIKVEEPSEEKTVLMIRGLVPVLEKHHKVHVLDEAVHAAARLSHRYIPSRQLPDKAVSLMDTACARVAISHHSTPAHVEESQRGIAALQSELGALDREIAIGANHSTRRFALLEELDTGKKELVERETAWKKEKDVVEKILSLRGQLQAPGQPEVKPSVDGREAVLKELRILEKSLAELQGENPLILPSVDEQAIASVVADWTGIPVGRMVKNEIQAVLQLADNMEKRIIGQRHALDAIAKRIQTSRASLDNPNKPIGVFLLAGTSGVGKTETALCLAESLYGGEDNVITINMSEFQEPHTVSTLKGAPPGYVGYGEGGVLTEAVRRRPYSVVLLDEVEKAHPDVHEIFFQVFDKGWMEDGEGRKIDFKNTIILLTTNAGSDLISNLCKDPDLKPDPEGMARALRPALLQTFPAALLGRLVVVPYYPLSDEMLKAIIRLQLSRVVKRLAENRQVELICDDTVVDLIAARCTELESGGRMVDAILTQTMLPDISRQLLNCLMDGKTIGRVKVSTQDSAFAYAFE